MRQGRAPERDENGDSAGPEMMPVPGPRLPAIYDSRQPLVARGDADADRWCARIVADQPTPPAARRPWAALLCCLAAILFLTAFVAGRQVAVTAIPDLAGLFAAVGLPVHLTGLAIEGVEAERRMEGSGAAIKVRGRVVNVGAGESTVPPLVIQFRDENGAVVYATGAAAPVASLAPGGAARFVVEVERVPSQAGQVLVRLQEAR